MSHVRLGFLLCFLLFTWTACTNAPTAPDSIGVPIVFTYRSIVPASMSWPSEVCDAGDDRHPTLVLNWTGSEIPMEQDAEDPALWRAHASAAPNVRIDVSLRDPGLCRLTPAPNGFFAWSGLSANDTALPATDATTRSGRVPCFWFRVTIGGDILVQSYR